MSENNKQRISFRRTVGLVCLLLFITGALAFWINWVNSPHIQVEIPDAAPLTAFLKIQTPFKSSVSIRVKGQDNNDIARSFAGFRKEHSIPVLGLYPDFENEVIITLESESGKKTSLVQYIQTVPLPSTYPRCVWQEIIT